MRRRDFIALLGGAAAAAIPAETCAQQARRPVIGYLYAYSPDFQSNSLVAFRDGLKAAGYEEGSNVAIEYRWAKGDFGRLPALASELVALPVDVIVAGGADNASIAAKKATQNIPIVGAIGSDPVGNGFVGSFNRPGGNFTTVSFFAEALVAKRMEILHQVVPIARKFAVLDDPQLANKGRRRDVIEQAARTLGIDVLILEISSLDDIEKASTTLTSERPDGLVVSALPFYQLDSVRPLLVALAARHALPTIYAPRETVEAGGLLSYGPSIVDSYHQVGNDLSP